MKTTFQFVLITLLFCVSCKEKDDTKAQKYQRVEQADWLLGRWENNSADGNLSESWKKINDSTLAGESYFVIKTDTVFAETIVLEDRMGSLFYTVTVPGQNQEKPVSFELTVGNETQMIFENPAHDFPNRIVYNKIGNDSLVAQIFGEKDGKEKSDTFKMGKVK